MTTAHAPEIFADKLMGSVFLSPTTRHVTTTTPAPKGAQCERRFWREEVARKSVCFSSTTPVEKDLGQDQGSKGGGDCGDRAHARAARCGGAQLCRRPGATGASRRSRRSADEADEDTTEADETEEIDEADEADEGVIPASSD